MAEPLVTTNRVLIALHKGLSSLDGARDGQDVVPFAFSRDVQWRLTCALVAAEQAKLAYDRIERATARSCGVYEGMDKNDVNAKCATKYLDEMEEILDKEVTIPDMPRFKLAELMDRPACEERKTRKTNPIPASVLKALYVILDEK